MGKRSAPLTPKLIEPDYAVTANKKCRVDPRKSAALTLLSIREGGETSVSKHDPPSTPSGTLSIEESVASSITDDEDDAKELLRMMSKRRLSPKPCLPPISLVLPSPGVLLHQQGNIQDSSQLLSNQLVPPVRPLAAPPVLRLPTLEESRKLSPLETHM